MKIKFDPIADAIYIQLKEIEITNASKRFVLQDLTRFTFDIFQSVPEPA